MRFGSTESHCRSCQEIYEASDLDRHLWCPACREVVRRRGARWGRITGLVASLGLVLYLMQEVHASQRFALFYALMVALTFVLTRRIAAALVLGYYRARGRAVDGHTTE